MPDTEKKPRRPRAKAPAPPPPIDLDTRHEAPELEAGVLAAAALEPVRDGFADRQVENQLGLQSGELADAPPAAAFVTVETGPRNARTDPGTGLRFYTWQGRELPSVTTVRRMAGIPWGLHTWSISQVVNRAVEQFDELTRMMTRDRRPRERVLEKNRREESARWLRKAATEERDAAAKLGTAVHDAAAAGTDPELVAEELRPRLRQFRDWLTASRAEVVASEFQCWNPTIGYAGSADLLARFPNGETWLVDLKTGKSVFAEHALQVLAYAMAEFVGEDNVVDPALTAQLHGIAGVAVLHLADDHWEWRSIRADADTWTAFRGLLAFALWIYHHGDADSVTIAHRSSSAEVAA